MTNKPIFIQFNDSYRQRTVNINAIITISREYITLVDGSLLSIGYTEKKALLDLITQEGELYSFDKKNRAFCKMEVDND